MRANLLERWWGVERWPETTAIISAIDQPFEDPKHRHLAEVRFSFLDSIGEPYRDSFYARTADLEERLTVGSAVKIRYNPRNPDWTWFEGDYRRKGTGLWEFGWRPRVWIAVSLASLLLSLIAVFIAITKTR